MSQNEVYLSADVTDGVSNTETVAETTTEETTATPSVEDLLEQVKALQESEAKWKAMSRKNEDNWKSASAKVAEFEKSGMSDGEKALAEAKEEGRNAALRELLNERAMDKLEASAAKAGVDISDVIEDINVARFVEGGDINNEAISQFVDKFAAKFGQTQKPKGRPASELGVGPNQGSKPSQLTRADLAKLSPAEIAQADADGRLDRLKGR